MRLFLHIGTYKTGSTALQSSFTINNKKLLEREIYWGEFSSLSNSHSNIAYGLLRIALEKENMFTKYETHPRFKNLAEDPEKVIESIVKNSKRNNCNTVVISNEALFADAFRTLCGLQEVYGQEVYDKINEDIRKVLRDIIKRYFDEVIIVCYLRRQDFFLESQYNQFCKQPWYGSECRLVEFDEFAKYKPISLDYHYVLSGWKQVFNKHEFIVRSYDKLCKDVIFDFFENVLMWKNNEIKKLSKVKRTGANLRWDRNIIEYKKYIGIENNKLNRALNEYAETMQRVTDYSYLKTEERKQMLLAYKECNYNIAKDYFKGMDFFDDLINIEEYKGLSRDEFIKITQFVLKEICV